MQNAASILMRIKNVVAAPSPRGWFTETLNRWLEVVAKLIVQLETYIEEETRIQADRHLSDDGKRAKLIAAATRLVVTLSWLARVLEALDDSIAEYKRTYFSVPQAKGDMVVAFLQEREVRENMAGFNASQKGLAYVLASERDDELTMRAIVNAPGQPWVAGEMKEKADATRAARLDPEGYRKHEQAKMLRESVASLREHVCVWALYLGVAQSTLVAVVGRMDMGMEIGNPVAAPRQTGEDVRQVIVASA